MQIKIILISNCQVSGGVSNCTILLIENYIYNGNDVYFDDLQSLF